jgi:hypothetical protein
VRIDASWPGPEEADIHVAVVRRRATSRVSRGENAGRTLSHVAIVSSLVRVGSGAGRWQGIATIPPPIESEAHLVAFAQAKEAGRILAVGDSSVASATR